MFVPAGGPDQVWFRYSNVMGKLAELIAATRRRLGPPPRSPGLLNRWYLRISPPAWMNPSEDDRFLRLYHDQRLLFQQGEVVWAHIIQANEGLFEPHDPDDLPAALVYGSGRYFDDHLDDLSFIAHHLFAIKGREMRHPELAKVAKCLADEIEVRFNHPLPPVLPTAGPIHYSAVMIHRKHLPVPHLAQLWFPLLVCPEQTKMSMILPSRYWAREMIDAWA